MGTVFSVRYELKCVIQYSFRREPVMADIILQAGMQMTKTNGR